MKTGRYLFLALHLLLIAASFNTSLAEEESPEIAVKDEETTEALKTPEPVASVSEEKEPNETSVIDTQESEVKQTDAVNNSKEQSTDLVDEDKTNADEVKEEAKEDDKTNADEAKEEAKEDNIKNPNESKEKAKQQEEDEEPAQAGPFIDLFGPKLLSLKMRDETHAEIEVKNTNEVLAGKKVIGIYFSADWCGPCRQFTPELVSFYNKMNERRGKKDEFEIIWVSRCRDVQSFGQYFTHMNWVALPPEEAAGQRGNMLATKYKVKGIPHLALLDEVGDLITLHGRTMIPQDKAGIGFPWRNPISSLYVTLLPRSLRFMLRSQINGLKEKVLNMMNVQKKQPIKA